VRSTENIEKLVKNLDLDIDTNTQTDQAVLNELLDVQKKSMKQQTAYALPNIRRFIMKNPMTKFAVAAVIIIAILIGVNPFGNSKTSVVWAEIAEHFESVPFFNLTIYVGDDSSQEAKKIQIWKSEDSRVRAYDGNVTICYDLKNSDMKYADVKNRKGKMTASARNFAVKSNDPMVKWIIFDSNTSLAKIFLDTLGTEGQFSLDTLIKSFPPNISGITPVATADTVASKEIIVFKAKSETTPEHLTIWALRESKLPVQMQFRDPRNGEYGDFFFNYSEKMDDTFFDPNAFISQ
jgi:hypothetical protein